MKNPTRKRSKCGTIAGYRHHIRKKEETCKECREASRAYMAARRAGKTHAVAPRKKKPTPTESSTEHPAPDKSYLRAGGKALWDEVHALYEVDPIGEVVLLEACRMKDRLDRLAGALAASSALWFELGDPIETAQGDTEIKVIVNGMIGEARQLQAAIAVALGKVGVLKPAKQASQGVSVMDQLAKRRAERKAAAQKKITGA